MSSPASSTAPAERALVEVRGLRFRWPRASVDCIDIEGLSVARGETVFIHGPSGCGKSILLSLLAGVLVPGAGEVSLLGTAWRALSSSKRDRYRADHVGYVFQQFNLLPYLSVLDNVLLPCRFSPGRQQAAVRIAGSAPLHAQQLLARMGLANDTWRRPARTLSVGQQQRVAAARALIGAPEIVIADEPTSALDEERRDAFLEMLLEACTSAGSALLFVSHDRRIAGRFGRQLALPEINLAARADAASGQGGGAAP